MIRWQRAEVEASQASAESRRAALAAAAALIGPSIPGGIVNRKPGEAATAALTLAEMFLPWLEGVPAPAEVRHAARAAATAAPASPETGEADGQSRAGPEAE